jgi:hypothetical protein
MKVIQAIERLSDLENKGDLAKLRRHGTSQSLQVLAKIGFRIDSTEHCSAASAIGVLISNGVVHAPEDKYKGLGTLLKGISGGSAESRERRVLQILKGDLARSLVRVSKSLKGSRVNLERVYWDLYGWGMKEKRDRSIRGALSEYYSGGTPSENI